VIVAELAHPTDPRWLRIDAFELPARITIDDLEASAYGLLFILRPDEVDVVYAQPDGPGSDWVCPTAAELAATIREGIDSLTWMLNNAQNRSLQAWDSFEQGAREDRKAALAALATLENLRTVLP
jgi:hypothetical protein